MCALATEGVVFEHVHVNPVTKEWEGKEEYGLVSPYKHRPDGSSTSSRRDDSRRSGMGVRLGLRPQRVLTPSVSFD